MSIPTMEDIANVNKFIKMARHAIQVKIVFAPDLGWENAILFGFGDSKHGNVDNPLLGKNEFAVWIRDRFSRA